MLNYTQVKKIIAENSKPFMLFAIIGGITAGFYISIFTLLLNLFHLHYQVALAISYVFSITFYFFANRSFTFKNQNAVSQQLPKYFIMLFFNYLATMGITYITVEILTLPPQFGIVAAIGLTFILNFLISKFWVFKHI